MTWVSKKCTYLLYTWLNFWVKYPFKFVMLLRSFLNLWTYVKLETQYNHIGVFDKHHMSCFSLISFFIKFDISVLWGRCIINLTFSLIWKHWLRHYAGVYKSVIIVSLEPLACLLRVASWLTKSRFLSPNRKQCEVCHKQAKTDSLHPWWRFSGISIQIYWLLGQT